MLERADADDDFLHKIIFAVNAPFHLSDRVSRQNVRIWGLQLKRSVTAQKVMCGVA